MRHAVPILALVFLASARAEPCQVGLHMISIHQKSGFDTVTLGGYVTLENGATAGALQNSEGRLSVYAGRTWQTRDTRWALTVGGITGYRGSVVTPLVIPSVRLGLWQDVSLRIAAIPKPPGSGGSAAVHFALERALK